MIHEVYETCTRDYKFKSPEMLIGKTYWRFVVYVSRYGLVTGYEFVEFKHGAYFWSPETEHLRYNSNDGMYSGLPKGLVKLWEDHKEEYEKLTKTNQNRI